MNTQKLIATAVVVAPLLAALAQPASATVSTSLTLTDSALGGLRLDADLPRAEA